jgi:dUTP pyrophosphatase
MTEAMSKTSAIEVRIMRLPHGADLPLPQYHSALAAGLDLLAAIPAGAAIKIAPGARATIPTGIAIALPAGYEGQVRPRSGLASRHGITVLNSPGTVDADYRGELRVILVNFGTEPFIVERGMRIAQLVIASVVQARLVESETLQGTARAGGGFGSTGLSSKRLDSKSAADKTD